MTVDCPVGSQGLLSVRLLRLGAHKVNWLFHVENAGRKKKTKKGRTPPGLRRSGSPRVGWGQLMSAF